MTQFFLAYEAYPTIGGMKKGFRVFEDEATTSEDVAQIIRNRLAEIAKTLGTYPEFITATAFNKV